MAARPKREPPEETKQVIDLRLKGGREVPAFYANSIQVLVSVYDVTLIIGQVGFGAEGEPEMREVLKVNLSPQHAKALVDVLAKRVADYERQFGTIALGPPNEPPQPS